MIKRKVLLACATVALAALSPPVQGQPPLEALPPSAMPAGLVSPCPCQGAAHSKCGCRSTLLGRLQSWRAGHPTHWCHSQQIYTRPMGVSLQCMLSTQIANGLVQRMTLYEYDFYPFDSEHAMELNPRGYERVASIARLLAYAPGPITIEPSGDHELDLARRLRVLAAMGQMAVPLDESQIRIAPAETRGLRGVEAELMYLNLLRHTQTEGAMSIGGTGAGGAAAAVPTTFP